MALGAVSFFTVGLGLGVPYIFLGTFTGLVNRFPRSGGWLVWTKRLMAMALAGIILYFMRPFIRAEFVRVLGTALFLFAAVYLGFLEGLSRRPFSSRFRAVRIVAAAALVAGAFAFHAAYGPAPAAGEASDDGGPHVEWTPWTEGALEAARAEGRPVLLYFTADWCIECRHWKAAIWSDPKVIAAAEGFARILVDVTQPPSGAKRDLAEAYRGVNPPAVILIGRHGQVHKAYRDPPAVEAFVGALGEAAGARPLKGGG
jgi:thiol:disulfide interchange protein DsbD